MRSRTRDSWPHEGPGALAFARAYLDFFDDVVEILNRKVEEHPVFGPMLAAMPSEVREEQARESRARLERAFAGDWDAYALPLREQGSMYAAIGIRFADWYDLANAWSHALTPPIVRRHAADPELLVATLAAMQGFIDRAMSILGESYIDASEAQIRARQSELERWEAIFRHAAWGVVVVDGNTVVETANPAFARLCGAEVLGKTLADFYAPGEIDRVRSTIHDSERAAGHLTFEANLLGPDGAPFPTLIDATRIPSGSTKGERWALNVIDLSERKKAEALQRRSAELELENRRVQEASRLKSEFLANMSHELRTPLNSIIGFAELLHLDQVGPMPPKQHEFTGHILTSGRHLLRLINDVLDLSKVESGTMQFRPEPLDLDSVVAEVGSVLRGIAAERKIVIESAIDPDIGALTLDPARLKQVLYNFLSNALKFSPAGGRVRVRAQRAGAASFRLEVEDEGPGIPVEQQHRLFVEFEQLDGGRSKTHAGTGLGLALTRRIVEAQGGTVGVVSAAGAGATFHAVLPRRATRASLPQPRRIAGASPRAPRILVVEDDPHDQDRIVSALVSAGYAVDTVATGAQARRACEERTYDAITLDLLLPDTSGLEVLAAVRSTAGNHKVPVIVISVVSEQITSGFVVHDVLQKPLRAEALLVSLGRAGISPPGSGPVLVVDDDEASAKLMAETLTQLGFRAVIVGDGAQALACARNERPSAVVLDLVMPKLDGFGFLEQFRAEHEWSTVPVFVWTMKDLGPEEHELLMRSARAVLLKDGGGARSLLDTMRALLPRQEAGDRVVS